MSQDVRPCTRLANTFPNYHRDYCERYPEKMRELFQRQSPGAMMLSCCDSRTDPALLFSCHPGDLFVHRAIAALVPPLDSPVGACIRAATNYAVDSLKVRDLIVLGHTACGGISEIPFLSGTSHDATTRTPTDIIPTRNPQNDSATSSCVNAGTTAGNGSTSRYPDDDLSPGGDGTYGRCIPLF